MIPKEKRPAWWDVVKELEQITGCPHLAFETNAKTAWEIQFAYWLAEKIHVSLKHLILTQKFYKFTYYDDKI